MSKLSLNLTKISKKSAKISARKFFCCGEEKWTGEEGMGRKKDKF